MRHFEELQEMPKECLRRSRDLEITLTPSRVLKWLRVEFKEPHDCSLDHSPCSLFFRKQTQILSCNNNEDKVSSQGSSSELQTGQESKDPLGKDNARNHTARPSGPTRLQQREEAVSSLERMTDFITAAYTEFYQLLFRSLGCPEASLL